MERRIQAEVDKRVAKMFEKKKRKKYVEYIPPRQKKYVKAGHRIVETAYGNYTVPLYDDLDDEEQQQRYNTFCALFMALNHNWRDKGYEFDMPNPNETLTNIDIRYQQSVKYIKNQTGCNMPKLILLFSWAAIQYIGSKMGLQTDGYFESQILMYDMYQSKLIEMGQISGFGEDWPAWIYLVITSLVNLAAMVILNTYTGKMLSDDNKTKVMRGIAGFFSGNNTAAKIDPQTGSISPSEDPLSDALGGFNIGGLNLTNMMGSFLSRFSGPTQDSSKRTRAKPAEI